MIKDIIQCQFIRETHFPRDFFFDIDNTDLVHLQDSTAFALFIIYITFTPCMLYLNWY